MSASFRIHLSMKFIAFLCIKSCIHQLLIYFILSLKKVIHSLRIFPTRKNILPTLHIFLLKDKFIVTSHIENSLTKEITNTKFFNINCRDIFIFKYSLKYPLILSLSNRLSLLNKTILLTWLNESLCTFEVKCKKIKLLHSLLRIILHMFPKPFYQTTIG